MVFRMRTTLNIDEGTFTELKREAARQGRTMSELVESALRVMLAGQRRRRQPRALPSANMGAPRVDVSNRDALYDLMERESCGDHGVTRS